ncbi:thiol reductant ABC exporter subunit CydD [Microbacterium sp. NPDC076911]|uniref:thiol reductant ABC exporter subunit CydD n=1 Tax=Microbacterium sp. NPDC076911 TaxID=3154958 RepID=UPI00341516B0
MNHESDAEAPPRTRGAPVDPRLLRYARASRAFFVAIAIVALLHTGLIVAFAWLLTQAIVAAIEGESVSALAPTLALLAAVVAARAVLLWARESIAARAASRVQTQLRAALVTAVGELGPGWLGRRNSTELAVTAGRGLDALEAYFGRYLPQLVQTAVATPLLIIVMWWSDWISGLTVVLTLPLIPIFMVLIGLATEKVQRQQWKTLQHLASRFADTVQGLSTLKIFGRQHRAAASIERVTDDYRRETMRVLRVSFLSGFALEFLASISVAIIAVSIGFRLIDGAMVLAVGLFVLLLAPEAYLPLRQVGVQFHAAAEGVAATDDVFEVLDAARKGRALEAPPSRQQPNALPVPTTALRVSSLQVSYGDRVLPPVSFAATPGSVTLFEGPSGAGKSSIFAALRGAAAFSGSACLGDTGVDALAPSEWLAWAGQQAGLLAGTVRENVVLGDPAIDEAIVENALALACADEIHPDVALGVQGAGLSGGQAHRVAVARAFYRHLRGFADVIALDEPSAALDSDTENRLWLSVRTLADRGAVVLLISHRSTARKIADQTVRLAASPVAPLEVGI